MKRLYILCEGQTEEEFIYSILNPYLQNVGIFAQPIICMTNKTPTKKYKGGVSSFSKVKKELQRLCREHPNEMVTTMFDLYAFPYDALGFENIPKDAYEKAKYIENAIANDIGNRFNNMIFNLILHEFEGLLFSDVSAFGIAADQEAVAFLQSVRNAEPTPEHINESPETAPSKQVEKAIPDYRKPTDGIDIAEQVGIEKIISECRHFANWVAKLTALAKREEQ